MSIELRTIDRSAQFEEYALLIPLAAMENQLDQSTLQVFTLGSAVPNL